MNEIMFDGLTVLRVVNGGLALLIIREPAKPGTPRMWNKIHLYRSGHLEYISVAFYTEAIESVQNLFCPQHSWLLLCNHQMTVIEFYM